VQFGVVLASLGLLLAIALFTLAVGYVAIRGHFDEIPLSRSNAVAMSSMVTTAFALGWLTVGIFGFAIGQSLGNQNLGSFIGGLVGFAGWLFTTLAYGWRITRGLARLQVAIRPSPPAPAGDRRQMWLRIGFIALVLVVAGVAFAALSRTASP